MDFSSEVVLGLLFHIAQLVPSVEIVLCIPEFNLASELVPESSHEKIVKLITLVVPFDV